MWRLTKLRIKNAAYLMVVSQNHSQFGFEMVPGPGLGGVGGELAHDTVGLMGGGAAMTIRLTWQQPMNTTTAESLNLTRATLLPQGVSSKLTAKT